MAHGAPTVPFGVLEKNANDFDLSFKMPKPSGVLPKLANNPFKLPLKDEEKLEIERLAADSWPILDGSVKWLLEQFIALKKAQGSDLEKHVYAEQHIDSAEQLVKRLLIKRPLMFMTEKDQYILREGFSGSGGFDTIHQGLSQRVPLDEYISYEEMQLSALLGVSTHTRFINSGSRGNSGNPGSANSFTPSGIYTGLVGARFERSGKMEYAHIVIDRSENTPARGYGRDRKVDPVLDLWAAFYQSSFIDAQGRHYFPSFDEVAALSPAELRSRRLACFGGNFFNVPVYIKRIELVLRPFFADAHERAKAREKLAYTHVVGLGLGVWQIDPAQQQFFVEAAANVLCNGDFASIGVVDFSYFFADSCGGARSGDKLPGTNITVKFSKRNPADPDVPRNHLLVAMYAWDSNSYPGNEYWAGMYSASGDPAAACCSWIAFLQNPLINPAITGENTHFYPRL